MDEYFDGDEEYDEDYEGEDMEGDEGEFGDEGDEESAGGMAGLQQLLRGGMGGGAGKEASKQALKHGLIQQTLTGLLRFKRREMLLAGTGALLMFQGAAWQPIVIGGLALRWLSRRGRQNASTQEFAKVRDELSAQLLESRPVQEIDQQALITSAEVVLRQASWRANIACSLQEYDAVLATYRDLIARLRKAEASSGLPLLDAALVERLQQVGASRALAVVRGEAGEGEAGAEEVAEQQHEDVQEGEDQGVQAVQKLDILLRVHTLQERLVPDAVKPDLLDRFVHRLATAGRAAAQHIAGGEDAWLEGSDLLGELEVTEEEAWQDFLDYRAKKAAAAPPAAPGGFGIGGFPGLGGMGGMGGLQQLLAGLGRR